MFRRSTLVAALASFALGKPQGPCRILPTDNSWPTRQIWDAFNHSIDGRLIKTIPIGQCNTIRQNWHIPDFHIPNPSSIMNPIFLNKSCDPFDPRETPCRIGAYVQYAVNVTSMDHVIKTVQFVKTHSIRFVVKSTGHDYMGRSTGTGALSVWMHNLKDITFIPHFQSARYTGPAFKVHPGALGFDLVTEAHKRGLAVVGGECPTVSFAGGYIQGGGHSALSSYHGLAADQTLEFEVITTQGKFVHASPTTNQDLYWALSGGGGGTYGIVWSVTVKGFQDLPVTIASINFTSEGIRQDTYWKAIDAYQASTPNLTNAKVWGMAQYTAATFMLDPVFAVNKSSAEVSALIHPFLDTLDNLGVNYVTATNTYSGYLEGYNTLTFLKDFTVADILVCRSVASGLSRSLWEDPQKLGNLQNTIRSILEGGTAAVDFILRPTLQVAGNPNNAVLPAWRNTERHFAVVIPLVDGQSEEEALNNQARITTEFIPELKQLTPGSGSYNNEADFQDPDFKQAFWGPNYNRLLAIKDKWDPDQLLYGSINVGGDRWKETEEGRLCRV
ncbi:putative isoamyl alcohol oxidase [Mycena albidolilacea]|uniref:Isoamyl alcohol oxidase n=1 Tax=Mycena albidolilacea TaxID=1033008 RepID=A0AAD7EJ12_9AGAR|nr:putative isoamyl alcohol oxidase [Mycena albidolilacea]